MEFLHEFDEKAAIAHEADVAKRVPPEALPITESDRKRRMQKSQESKEAAENHPLVSKKIPIRLRKKTVIEGKTKSGAAILVSMFLFPIPCLDTETADDAKKYVAIASLYENDRPTIQSKKDGTIIWTNKAVFDMFGYLPSDLIGRNVSLLMPEPHRTLHDKVCIVMYCLVAVSVSIVLFPFSFFSLSTALLLSLLLSPSISLSSTSSSLTP